jgi:hypothetical protein
VIAEPARVDGATVRATIRAGGVARSVRWVLPGPAGGHPDDAVLATALLPAMAAGDALTIESAVSRRLLDNVPTIQDVFATWSRDKEVTRGWDPVFRRISVHAPARPAAVRASDGGCAAFFTGGVDSFYTAVQRREELSALVFVHGFDVPLGDAELRARVARELRLAAGALGLPLFEVETDVRELSEPSVRWLDYHGAALAGVALLLAPWFRTVYVPATMTYSSLDPLGSHPLVDPLWSTEDVELVHDGCEATRLDKLRTIASCDAARAFLRVCPKNWDGAYNCGRCEKCLRTMVAVALLDGSPQFASLPALDDEALRRIARVDVPGNGATWEVLQRVAVAERADPALVRALRRALRRRTVRAAGRSVVQSVRRATSRTAQRVAT